MLNLSYYVVVKFYNTEALVLSVLITVMLHDKYYIAHLIRSCPLDGWGSHTIIQNMLPWDIVGNVFS